MHSPHFEWKTIPVKFQSSPFHVYAYFLVFFPQYLMKFNLIFIYLFFIDLFLIFCIFFIFSPSSFELIWCVEFNVFFLNLHRCPCLPPMFTNTVFLLCCILSLGISSVLSSGACDSTGACVCIEVWTCMHVYVYVHVYVCVFVCVCVCTCTRVRKAAHMLMPYIYDPDEACWNLSMPSQRNWLFLEGVESSGFCESTAACLPLPDLGSLYCGFTVFVTFLQIRRFARRRPGFCLMAPGPNLWDSYGLPWGGVC